MAATARKGSACPTVTGLSGSDTIISVATVNSVVNTYQVSATNLLANTSVPHVTVGNNALSTANLIIRSTSYIPTTNSSNGVTGQVAWDSNSVYVCIATNTWRKAALATF